MQIIATLPILFTMQDSNYDPHLFWIIAIVTRRSCFLQMMIRKIRMIFVKSMNFDACTFYWCFRVCFLIANFIFISYHGWQSKPQVTLYRFQKWLRNIVVSERWSKNWSYKLVRWWGGAYTCFCIWTSPQASTWFVISLWRCSWMTKGP